MRPGRIPRHHRGLHIVVTSLLLVAACTDDGNRVTALGRTSPPVIDRIIPGAGPVGTPVTISGASFTARGNTVQFGPGHLEDVASPDGRTLPFVVPDGYTLPYGLAFPPVRPGPHVVRVVNPNGTSNEVVFTVTRP